MANRKVPSVHPKITFFHSCSSCFSCSPSATILSFCTTPLLPTSDFISTYCSSFYKLLFVPLSSSPYLLPFMLWTVFLSVCTKIPLSLCSNLSLKHNLSMTLFEIDETKQVLERSVCLRVIQYILSLCFVYILYLKIDAHGWKIQIKDWIFSLWFRSQL